MNDDIKRLVEGLERIKGLSWRDPKPELEASYAQQAIAVAQSIASQALASLSTKETDRG